MTYEPLNRRLAALAAVFAFLGVILGVIALATNYWTFNATTIPVHNDTGVVGTQTTVIEWNVSILLYSDIKENQILSINFHLCIFLLYLGSFSHMQH